MNILYFLLYIIPKKHSLNLSNYIFNKNSIYTNRVSISYLIITIFNLSKYIFATSSITITATLSTKVMFIPCIYHTDAINKLNLSSVWYNIESKFLTLVQRIINFRCTSHKFLTIIHEK